MLNWINWILNGWKTNYSILLILENLLFKNSLLYIKVVSSLATDFSYNLHVLITGQMIILWRTCWHNCPSKCSAICENFNLRTEGTVKQCIKHTSHMNSHKCIVVNLYKHLYMQKIFLSSSLLTTLKDEFSDNCKHMISSNHSHYFPVILLAIC